MQGKDSRVREDAQIEADAPMQAGEPIDRDRRDCWCTDADLAEPPHYARDCPRHGDTPT